MTNDDIVRELAKIADEAELDQLSYLLVQRCEQSKVGVNAIEPILRFMENHPDWDYGMPGPFVHVMENFYNAGYEDELLKSIERKPIMHTIWMLNRVINGESNETRKQSFLDALASITGNSLADPEVVELAEEFLAMHAP